MGKSCNSTSISKETCEVTHRSNPEEPEDRGYRVGSATTTQHTTRPEATAQYPTEDHERIPREKKPSITAEYRTNIIRMGRLAELQLQLMRREYENNILGFVEECDRRIRAAQKRLEKHRKKTIEPLGWLMREIGEIQTGYEGAMGEVENLGRWLLRCFLEHVYKDIAFKVVTDTYVTSDSGAGNLHQAPAFGADDHEGYKRHGVVPADVIPPCPIDDGGRFTSDVPDFQGQHVKEADPRITQFWLLVKLNPHIPSQSDFKLAPLELERPVETIRSAESLTDDGRTIFNELDPNAPFHESSNSALSPPFTLISNRPKSNPYLKLDQHGTFSVATDSLLSATQDLHPISIRPGQMNIEIGHYNILRGMIINYLARFKAGGDRLESLPLLNCVAKELAPKLRSLMFDCLHTNDKRINPPQSPHETNIRPEFGLIVLNRDNQTILFSPS
ncbi:hypothetical protein PGT21_036802 [Puccinia graminis f. sp. tritici]|uniref:Uncharacterized protein n=1 Tax=Puccinia graminis f. sp. tritici TaxID=56615 RepID=A0A5B0PNP3_PUCGR|nr:hypothetical protein PGT21_036802 [Puccinia graminis f. sp. tritici]